MNFQNNGQSSIKGEKLVNDLLFGNISLVLWRLAWPMIIAMFAMVAFNLVDTIYIGRIGTRELGAISFTFPVVFLFNGLIAGLGLGATSIISRKYGAGDFQLVSRLAFDSLALGFVITILFMIVGFFTIGPLFRALGAKSSVFPLIKSYMVIWYIGVIFVVIPMIGNSIIRATGDTKTPMKIMLLAVIINVVMDPLLIFGVGPFPKMGIKGAAWATVTARGCAMVLTLHVLRNRRILKKLSRPRLREICVSWKSILHVGGPTAIINVLTPISQGIITAIVAGYGLTAIAGYGAATRMEALVLMPIIAFCIATVPFIGQNFGAGRLDRIKKAVTIGYKYAIVFGIFIYIVLGITAHLSGKLFNNEKDVIQMYSIYIYFTGLGWLSMAINFFVYNSYNAMGKPVPAAVLALIRVFLLIVPFALLGSYFLDIHGVFLGISLGNIVCSLLSITWLNRSLMHEGKRFKKSNIPKPKDIAI